jgi:serine phosphatase RsbU (regulator of sigma subunit)
MRPGMASRSNDGDAHGKPPRVDTGQEQSRVASGLVVAARAPASGVSGAATAPVPPVLVLPGGATQVLDLPPGLPLGVGAESFEATQSSLPAGATVALYTDGLVESRIRPLDDGLAALRDALSSALAWPGAPFGDACETAAKTLGEHGEDDVTLVLARIRQ